MYIGQSVNIERRWQGHLKSKDNCPIHKAIRKYSSENFDFKIIALCSRDELNQLEQFYIQEYGCMSPNGYNCNSGGGQRIFYSEETRRRMSELHKGVPKPWLQGKPKSEEHRRKLSESHKGRPSPNKGKPRSEETREKISKTKKLKISLL